ncbi:uncharacterised protein [Saccharolobus solfataricus]|uniref:Uncharacterized protein n=2 Tax=Saccharolobus solfataricus TaxID=2287 RepID=A0A157T087_SACSO|nr:uncharacterised protein [Saccharolobus solfataricus]
MAIFLKYIRVYGKLLKLLSKLFSYYLNRNVTYYLDFSIFENQIVLSIFKNNLVSCLQTKRKQLMLSKLYIMKFKI